MAPPSADTAELLRGVPLFAGLSGARAGQDRARRGAAHATRRARIILREGDPGDTCYVLQRGPRARHAPARRRAHDHAHEPRARARSSASSRCSAARSAPRRSRRSTTCEAVAILAGDLKRLLNEHPEIAVKLLGALGEKLREANARIARQSFQKVSSRVAGVLAELAETGSRAGRGRGAAGEPPREVVVRSTQADLAQLAGTSREAASRFLATLQRAGVVTTRRGRIVVHDPPALHRYIY